jgi:hypothetical protein
VYPGDDGQASGDAGQVEGVDFVGERLDVGHVVPLAKGASPQRHSPPGCRDPAQQAPERTPSRNRIRDHAPHVVGVERRESCAAVRDERVDGEVVAVAHQVDPDGIWLGMEMRPVPIDFHASPFTAAQQPVV